MTATLTETPVRAGPAKRNIRRTATGSLDVQFASVRY